MEPLQLPMQWATNELFSVITHTFINGIGDRRWKKFNYCGNMESKGKRAGERTA